MSTFSSSAGCSMSCSTGTFRDRGDLLDHGVGLGVNGGHVEGVIAVADAQEAGGLLEGLGADAGHLLQLHAGAETAVLIAELDDIEGGALGDAGDVAQQGPGSGVEIHADPIDAALDHRFQRFLQLPLIDVVLILAHADGLGIDLDELGQRVLQAARDGDGSAHGQIEIGELLAGDLRGGIDAGARLAHGHTEDAVEIFCLAGDSRTKASVSREAVPLPMAMARTLCFAISAFSVRSAPAMSFLGWMRVDDIVAEELARLVHHGDLAAGAEAGVDAQHARWPGGRSQQQVAADFRGKPGWPRCRSAA